VLSERYHLVERIGEGGMGVIYRAEHIHMRKAFAVKVLHPSLTTIEEVVLRFEREAQAAGQIDHPNVCAATDFGRAQNGAFFLVMEFLEGKTLKELIDEDGSLSIPRAIAICRQICAALSRAHGLGIVHRDLKPENVQLIERDGEVDFVKVLDFGIAGMALTEESGAIKTLTKAGTVMGTPAYISPEQAAGAKTDQRTDLYSLGICLFEMVAGRRPFDSDSIVELMGMHVTRPAPRLSSMATSAAIPRRLDQLVDRMLAKDPNDRPADAEEVRRELDLVEDDLRQRERSVSARLRQLVAGSNESASGLPALFRDLPKAAWAIIAAHLLVTTFFLIPFSIWVVRAGLGAGETEAGVIASVGADASAPDGGATDLAPSPLDEARTRPEVQQALSLWKTHGPVVAARRLGDLYEHAPTPELAYLLASAEAETDQRFDALRHVHVALDGNPELAKEAGPRPFVLQELGGRQGWLSYEIVQEHYLPYVVPELSTLACATDWTQGQKKAQGLLVKARALDRIELWCKLSIELDVANSCKTRLEIIRQIRELGDPRALPALGRVDTRRRGVFRRRSTNSCLINELRATRRALGDDGAEAAADAGPP
jgi:serine/threonine-protein kinase